MLHGMQNRPSEWSYHSPTMYAHPDEVELDLVFTDPDGQELVLPAFWGGDQTWRARFAPAKTGTYRYRTVCSDTSNTELHGQKGQLEVRPYEGHNALLQRGPLRVAGDGRHLEHRDGTPFFWLGDTWWHGLTQRFHWPEDVRMLAADRAAKGFTLIQIVAGLLPELTPDRYWTAWSANEAGWAWEPDFTRLNPAFFDMADLRIEHLVRAGLVPCIVGAWGYYLHATGVEKMKRHWRNLVARYGAYPVVWCVAGEVNMPLYDSQQRDQDRELLTTEWTAVARYLRQIDPYHHPVTAHPGDPRHGRGVFTDEAVVDIDMLQTAHAYPGLASTVELVREYVALQPRKPVLIGEVCYEGEYGTNWQDVQSLCFWTSITGGACGHTYGANNIWQMNSPTDYFVGIRTYGDIPWYEAMHLPGSTLVGVGRRILERYPWWQFAPRQEEGWDTGDRLSPFITGMPGRVWLIYLASDAFERRFAGLKGKTIAIEPGVAYRSYFINPRTGRELPIGPVVPDAQGRWAIPESPTREDMLLVIEA